MVISPLLNKCLLGMTQIFIGYGLKKTKILEFFSCNLARSKMDNDRDGDI